MGASEPIPTTAVVRRLPSRDTVHLLGAYRVKPSYGAVRWLSHEAPAERLPPSAAPRVPLLCRALAWEHIRVVHVVTEVSLITSAPRCSLRTGRGYEIELERGQLHRGLGLLLLHAPMFTPPVGWGMITSVLPLLANSLCIGGIERRSALLPRALLRSR